MSQLSRRTLLGGLAGLPFALSACDADATGQQRGASPVRPAPVAGFDRRLPIPPLAESRVDATGVRHFRLRAAPGDTEIVRGRQTPTWGYDGPMLGPTIRARAGETVAVEVDNQLPEVTTVHWHGMHLPARYDGGPHQPIEPGTTWSPTWNVDQPAATLWYHPHPHGATQKHVYRGLAGLFLIDDDQSIGLELPNRYGLDDVPLVLQDMRFNPDGTLDESNSSDFGLLGDVIVSNGIAGAYLPVPGRRVRLRILNGSTARMYNLGLADGRDVQLIASDGGLVERPVSTNRVQLSPGERVEVIVDLADQPVMLRSYPIPEGADLYEDTAQFGLTDTFDVLELRPTGSTSRTAAVPTALTTISRLDPATAATTREFTLRWYEINDDDWPHNFHIHDVQFQILDIGGRPPPPELAGWKDTVYVAPRSPVRLIMRFSDYSDPTLPYMYHCHMLTHEDEGMMGQFLVLAAGQEPDPMTMDGMNMNGPAGEESSDDSNDDQNNDQDDDD